MASSDKKSAPVIRRVPYWVFLTLFILSASFTVYAFRNNNQTMIDLRDEVYAADKNAGDVELALNDLRAYVYGHMNTDLSSGDSAIKPPIQLKYTYERLLAAEQKRVEEINAKVYTDAQNYCQAQNPDSFSGGPRVPCVEQYVTSHGTEPVPIAASLYKFDFISPSWSPDLAGWGLILSAVLFMLSVASFLVDKMVRARPKA